MPEIIIKNAALERTLSEIADAYRACCPSEYTAFLALVNTASASQKQSSGMSDEGHFMDLMRFPGTLYPFIKHQMRKRHGIDDFFRDKANYRLVMKVWSDLKLKHKATSIFRVKPTDYPNTKE